MITVKVHKHASTVNNKDYPGGIDEVQQIAISSTEQNMQQVDKHCHHTDGKGNVTDGKGNITD